MFKNGSKGLVASLILKAHRPQYAFENINILEYVYIYENINILHCILQVTKYILEILENAHFPNLRPKGARTPPIDIYESFSDVPES